MSRQKRLKAVYMSLRSSLVVTFGPSSIRIRSSPASASTRAAVAPPAPVPTITTSAESSTSVLARIRRRARGSRRSSWRSLSGRAHAGACRVDRMDPELFLHLRQPAEPQADDHLEHQAASRARRKSGSVFSRSSSASRSSSLRPKNAGEAPEQERRTEHDQPDAGAHTRDELERRRIEQVVEKTSERRIRGSPRHALADAGRRIVEMIASSQRRSKLNRRSG